jgi:CRP/FNR family transcriptional regulator
VRKQRGKRETLFRQGDAAHYLFRITEGAVALEQFLEDGRRQLVELLLPGNVCGLSAGGAYTATGVALVATTFDVLGTAELERQPELGALIVRQLQGQLCAAHDHLLTVGRMAAQERVCSLLIRLAGSAACIRRPECRNGSIAIHIPLTRGEMGDYLGLSLETVCRVMSDLERRGVIQIGQRHGDLLINDLARMKRLIN